ncbi:hypothetical protein FB451DRAFT_1402887 [Mycena latifolia]|nr:hypothetical protein FB451DRAFT_1402887 [Mycena latifolia]
MSDVHNVINDVAEDLRTNYVGFAGFTILIWDHLDTFPAEVEYIWKAKKGLFVYLFLLNRYLTPLGFIVNLFGKQNKLPHFELEADRHVQPTWHQYGRLSGINFAIPSSSELIPGPRCQHFVRFEGSMTVIGIHVVAIMMLMRYFTLSQKLLFYVSQLVFQHKRLVLWPKDNMRLPTPPIDDDVLRERMASDPGPTYVKVRHFSSLFYQRHIAVQHDPSSGVRACTMIFPPDISTIASSSAWLPLLYDSVVLGLTLNKTVPLVRRNSKTFMMKRILEDGLIYYSAIFSVTLVLTIMIIFAPPGLKNIAAQLELLITVTMMSRITLNLRKSARKRLLASVITFDPQSIAFGVADHGTRHGDRDG